MELTKKETVALMNHLSHMSLVEIKANDLKSIFLRLILEEATLASKVEANTPASHLFDPTSFPTRPQSDPNFFEVMLTIKNPRATIYLIKAIRIFKGLSLADARSWLALYNPAGTSAEPGLRGPLATFVSLQDAQSEVNRSMREFNINGVGALDVGYCIRDKTGKIYWPC